MKVFVVLVDIIDMHEFEGVDVNKVFLSKDDAERYVDENFMDEKLSGSCYIVGKNVSSY